MFGWGAITWRGKLEERKGKQNTENRIQNCGAAIFGILGEGEPLGSVFCFLFSVSPPPSLPLQLSVINRFQAIQIGA
jgi:hypothetical protein